MQAWGFTRVRDYALGCYLRYGGFPRISLLRLSNKSVWPGNDIRFFS